MGDLFETQTLLKVILFTVTYPIWGKVLKSMWQEIQRSMASEGGVFGSAEIDDSPRPPGLDPFFNIPLAEHRRGRGTGSRPPANEAPTQPAASGAARSGTGAADPRPGQRATGFRSAAGHGSQAGANRRPRF